MRKEPYRGGLPKWIYSVAGWRRWLRMVAAVPAFVFYGVLLCILWVSWLPWLGLVWICHFTTRAYYRIYGTDYTP